MLDLLQGVLLRVLLCGGCYAGSRDKLIGAPIGQVEAAVGHIVIPSLR